MVGSKKCGRGFGSPSQVKQKSGGPSSPASVDAGGRSFVSYASRLDAQRADLASAELSVWVFKR